MTGKTQLRLGIYGGTFDPVHIGHLLLARDAMEQCRLDAVLFVPCARSPLKVRGALAPDARRLAMLKLAVRGESRFWLSRCELDRPAPSYSIQTAQEIREAFPHANLFWLLGHDQWAQIDRWRSSEELRRLVRFIRLPRKDGAALGPAGKAERVLDLPRPRRIDISATEIRRRVKSGLPIDHLVPHTVVAYIRRHALYRS
jgi:nicotinate-nucleotide adenylyltransferase